MTVTRTATVLLGVIALLTRCDPIDGINRDAQLSSLPELSCVQRAVRSISVVESVRRRESRGGRPLTLTGLDEPDQLYYFSYEVEGRAPHSPSALITRIESRCRSI